MHTLLSGMTALGRAVHPAWLGLLLCLGMGGAWAQDKPLPLDVPLEQVPQAKVAAAVPERPATTRVCRKGRRCVVKAVPASSSGRTAKAVAGSKGSTRKVGSVKTSPGKTSQRRVSAKPAAKSASSKVAVSKRKR